MRSNAPLPIEQFETAGLDQRSTTTRGTVAERDPSDPGTWGKIGRNEPFPCGSGKKFKHCHGQFA